jgi:hypothetical protein
MVSLVLTMGLRMMLSGQKRFLRGVILDDSTGTVTTIEHLSDRGASHARQARDLHAWLGAKLAGNPGIERVLLFEADHAPRAQDTDAARLRLRLEGAALAAALDAVPIVEIRNGRGLGLLIGGTKDKAIAEGAVLAADPFHEAAAAAKAASVLPV